MAAAVIAMMTANSCSLEPYEIPMHEQFTRDFIKAYGLIDPEQDWNMAKKSAVRLELDNTPHTVQVYSKLGQKYYRVANCKGLSGIKELQFDVFEGSSALAVVVDGARYFTTLGGTVRHSTPARSRTDVDNDIVKVSGSESPTNDPSKNLTLTGYEAIAFVGDIPEGEDNRGLSNINYDYMLIGKGHDNPIVIYPLYWNSSQTHTFGIYYFTGDEVEDATNIVRVPLYTTKTADVDAAYLKTVEETGDISNWGIKIAPISAGTITYDLGWVKSTTQIYTINETSETKEWYHTSWIDQWPASALAAFQNYLTINDFTDTALTDEQKEEARAAIESALQSDASYGPDWTVTALDVYNPNDYKITAHRSGLTYDGSAPAALVDAVGAYLRENGMSVTDVSVSDDGFKAAAESGMTASGMSGYTLTNTSCSSDWSGNTLTVTFTNPSAVIGPVNTGGVPTDVYNYIILSMGEGDSYNDLSSDTFRDGLNAAIQAYNPNYTLSSWSPSYHSATLTVSVSTGETGVRRSEEYVTQVTDALQDFMTNEMSTRGLNDFNDYQTNPAAMEALDKAMHDSTIMGSYVLSEDQHVGISLSTFSDPRTNASLIVRTYTTTVKAANAASAWGDREQVGQTSYNYDYSNNVYTTGITYSVEAGRRYGFYVECASGRIIYSEIEGNMERAYASHLGDLTDEMRNSAAMRAEYTFSSIFESSVTKRTYITFEDWLPYIDNSGDFDINDLVMFTYDIDPEDSSQIISDKHPSTNSDVSSWLLVAEDLGSTDDFDFNDFILRISKETVTYDDDDSDGVEGETTVSITVKAMAAGGVKPLWLHYSTGSTDYIIGPKSLGVTPADEVNASNANDYEWHRWFGIDYNNVMINTGSSHVNGDYYTLPSSIFPSTFSLTDRANAVADGSLDGFYITVDSYLPSSQLQNPNNPGLPNSGGLAVGLPDTGAAPQMFLIPDVGYGGKTGWDWPSERTGILSVYPSFKEWCANAGATTWYQDRQGVSYHTNNE